MPLSTRRGRTLSAPHTSEDSISPFIGWRRSIKRAPSTKFSTLPAVRVPSPELEVPSRIRRPKRILKIFSFAYHVLFSAKIRSLFLTMIGQSLTDIGQKTFSTVVRPYVQHLYIRSYGTNYLSGVLFFNIINADSTAFPWEHGLKLTATRFGRS